MQKRLFFYLISALALIDMTTYVFLVPILPDFLLKKGFSLSMIGVILSFYQISSIITSLYLGKNLIFYSKIRIIIIGQILLVFSNLGLAFLSFFESETVVIFLAILFRLIQGAALSFVCSATYSYIPNLFPLELERSYAFMEICTGIGLALGPVIAGFLYEFTGFMKSFLIMSVVYVIAGAAIFPYMLKIDKLLEEEAKIEQENSLEEVKNLEVMHMLKDKNVILTLLVFWFSLTTYCVIQPDFSDHIHSYNGSDDTVGLIFGLSDLMYALTGFLVMHLINKFRITRKYLFLFGGMVSMVSLLIIGPDDITFLPKNLITVTVGMGFLGCSQMLYVPIFIPEIIDILKEMDGKRKGNEEMASSLFIASLGGISFLGTVLGGFLSDEFGFARGMTIYAFFLFGYLIFYGFVRKVPKKSETPGKPENVKLDSEMALLDDETIKQ